MEGQYCIELFDAGTGRKQEEVKDKNVITNAYKTMFQEWYTRSAMSPNLFWHGSGGYIKAPINYSDGVFLFDEEISSNPDDFIIDRPRFASAGSEYAGTDSSRGTLNVNETGEVANGYRWVWDFSTDKANGTIRALGLVPSELGDMTTNFSYFNWATGTSDRNYEPYRYNGTTVHFSNNVVLRFHSSNSIYKWAPSVSGYQTGHAVNNIASCSLSGYDNVSSNAEGIGGYYYIIARDIALDQYHLIKINPASMTIAGTYHLTTNTSAIHNWGFLTGTKIAMLKSYTSTITWQIYDIATGSYEADFSHSAFNRLGSSCTMRYLGNCSVVFSWYTGYGAWWSPSIIIPHDTLEPFFIENIQYAGTSSYSAYYNNNALVNMNGIPLHIMNNNCRSSSYSYGQLGHSIAGLFLFSRANLETPIVKTSSNTLKITYQLNW
jgi:hypothetical protein